jgi:hypothetical protein
MMLKNIFLLGLLTWLTVSYAKGPVVIRETVVDAERYKLEKPTRELEATRSVAGSKIKKQKKELKSDAAQKNDLNESDSEVRYWQYSE